MTRIARWARVMGVMAGMALLLIVAGARLNAEAAPPAAHAGETAAPLAGTLALTETVYLPIIMRDPLDLTVSRFEIIQGTTMSAPYRVHIADRAALVRVFVGWAGGSTLPSQSVQARLTCYQGAAVTNVLTSTATISTTTNESSLSQTINFSLAANSTCVDAGAALVAEIDPLNAIAEQAEGNNSYSTGGNPALAFQAVDQLKVKFIPIAYQPGGTGPVYTPPTADITYLTWVVTKVLPISVFTPTVGAAQLYTQTVLQNGTGWNALLSFVTSLHFSEGNSDTLYYGVIDTVQAQGCNGRVAGLGWIGWPTAIGDAGCNQSSTSGASWTFVHEAGHNFGRNHVLCAGNESGADSSYPYSGGKIGVWGLDVATNSLYTPSTYADYMSYCGSKWISDYTYNAIYNFRVSAPYRIVNTSQPMDSLYLSGWMEADGALTLGPVYQQVAPVETPVKGEYRAELRDAQGGLLGARLFDMTPIADGPAPAQGFHFFMPYAPGVTQIRIYRGNALLAERTATGAAPRVGAASTSADGRAATWALTAGSNVVYRVRFSPDGGQTWEVLALGQSTPQATIPPERLQGAPNPILEIQAADGVRTDTKRLPLVSK